MEAALLSALPVADPLEA
jgi:hypothetical protein